MSTAADAVLSGAERWCVLRGSCLELLDAMPAESIDSCVTDVPYELGFMSKAWDRTGLAVNPATYRRVLRVLKPGAHLLVFGGTRTYHRIACAIEDAGFEIRDSIGVFSWLYASGFPKSLNLSLVCDKADGVADLREVVHRYTAGGNAGTSTKDKGGTFVVGAENSDPIELTVTRGATEKSRKLDGIGTALKPAWEPVIVARKPVVGTVVQNALKHGTGGLNIDACRVSTDWNEPDRPDSWKRSGNTDKPDAEKIAAPAGNSIECHPGGRWPPNVLFVHSKQPWLVLRDDIGDAERDAILDFYGAREAVRALRQAHDGDAARDGDPEVLLQGMHWRVTAWSSENYLGNDRLRALWRSVSGDAGMGEERAEAVLLEDLSPPILVTEDTQGEAAYAPVSTGDQRQEKSDPENTGALVSMERREDQDQRLRAGNDRPIAGNGAGDCQTDDAREIHTGTPDREGCATGAAAHARRDRSSQKRDKGRQRSGQPGDQTQGGAYARAPRNGAPVAASGSRERATTGRIVRFEVAFGAVPPNWLSRFDPAAHHPGCKRSGSKVVKGTNPPGPGCSPDARQWSDDGGWKARPAHTFSAKDGTETVAAYDRHESCHVRELEGQSGVQTSGTGAVVRATAKTKGNVYGTRSQEPGTPQVCIGDTGTAARFFPQFEIDDDTLFLYCAKAARAERELGCERLPARHGAEIGGREHGSPGADSPRAGAGRINPAIRNTHNTVKPLELMRWLVRLATPKDGVCLDFTCGSGTTGIAALLEDRRFVGIELNDTEEEPYVRIARARIGYYARAGVQRSLFAGVG